MRMVKSNISLSFACLILVYTGGAAIGQEEGKPTEAWIAQLGADRVRLRDEAEDHLRNDPGAYDALVAFAETGTNEEAVIRARNVLRHLKSFRWELIGIRQGHSQPEQGNIVQRGLVTAPNGQRVYSRARDHIREWDARSYEPLRTFGGESRQTKDFGIIDGFCRALAVSPNSRMIASSSEQGEVIIHDTKSLKEMARFGPEEAQPFIESGEPFEEGAILSALFLFDHRRILTGHRWGVRMWDIGKRKLIWTSEMREPAFSMALTRDRQGIVVCGDPPGSSATLFTLAVGNGRTIAEFELPTRLGGLTFDAGGGRLLGFGRDGCAWVHDYDPETGVISGGRSFGSIGKNCLGAIWGPGEKTILATSWNPGKAMVEWDLETGETLWTSPPLDFGLCTPAWIDRERIAVLGAGGILSFWKYRGGK